ncbi:FAD-binding oxidoreductase [Ketogulonicigenium vulgare]|uniref:Oxidoreductase, FAD-binding protein n=1 Tax=Ketogulonicigenium vulgare (strain WSH-001) TaxID=759362 RepID=F9Y9H3_KETVW|nr:FAD-binding oxidoreductase [Ketogulonicigenium vulgare]ADO41931.1 FAD linked oxidase, C-terminal domain protein [Ketogulonicigenium vulgare Y25]AEM40155.1 Oxidoreductase, FAD-binding protein [Ketogulonicigenium vulgare WSH-001]ALJ80360.1 hydroxyacid dehydrogenase [Ketogulonicigenium vulgare]ANW33194.1 hydroxyacid dehydrogenase [Ketogulonicigenium vulgare]AOZ53854.1 FAD linked oxidase, C-terminal domain protein [Ketogulonicigenium vulgare]
MPDRLNDADQAFVDHLRGLLPAAAFLDASDTFLTEPRGRYRGKGVVVAPATTDEVAALIRACNAARVGVVPHGGGTGLVGAQVLVEGAVPIILSLSRMTRVRAIYAEEGVMIADAGAVLADLQTAALNAGKMFALSLGSEGTARIGGLLSTNAGGLNVLRYGTARAQCLGLEVVTPEGEIWHGLTRLHKDNTGYDLRDIFIGAEGTLGVITGAALKLSPIPAVEGSALLAVTDPAAALSLLSLARDIVGEGLSGFELMSRVGFDFMMETGLMAAPPLQPLPDWQVLLRVGLSAGSDADDALERIFTAASEAGLVQDGLIATTTDEANRLWAMRETIPEGNRLIGSIASHDISLPLSRIADYIPEAARRIAALGPLRINCFGHLGDGNLHYNVFAPKGEDRKAYDPIRKQVSAIVHDLAVEMGGSFSAEHGVGRLKVGEVEQYNDPVRLNLMRRIKASFDPNGIMNPGAMLRS